MENFFNHKVRNLLLSVRLISRFFGNKKSFYFANIKKKIEQIGLIWHKSICLVRQGWFEIAVFSLLWVNFKGRWSVNILYDKKLFKNIEIDKNTSNFLIVKLNAYNFIVVVTGTLVQYTNFDCDREDEDDNSYDISNH